MLVPSSSVATPPYTQFVLDAIARWQFEPARDIDYKGMETTVEMPVTDLRDLPAACPDERANHRRAAERLEQVSGDAAYPTRRQCRMYPPQARDGGVVLNEITLDEGGGVTERAAVGIGRRVPKCVARGARAMAIPRQDRYRARPVPATAYVIFGFRAPVGLDVSADTGSPRRAPPASVVSSFR